MGQESVASGRTGRKAEQRGDRSGLHRTFLVVATLIAALVAAVLPAAAAPVAPRVAQQVDFDKQMLVLINQARTANGLPVLAEARGLTAVAVNWSNKMNAGDTGFTLAHNPNAWTQVAQNGASSRTSWAENVAWASTSTSTAQQVFDAYMKSAGHRANILGKDYKYIGVGTVSGTRGLWNTVEFTDKVETGQVVSAAVLDVVEGIFVRAGGAVYRIVGGAPVYVSNWASVGGAQPVVSLTTAEFGALNTYPKDGTFVRAGGAVYQIVGGAPLYVSSWAAVGGTRSAVTVDPAAITNAGKSGVWSHLRKAPADNTFVRAGTGSVFQFVGGAPLYVSSWAAVGGTRSAVTVDPSAVTKAGTGRWANLSFRPADGTFVRAAGKVYRIAGGAPLYVSSWAAVGTTGSPVTIDPLTVTNGGKAGSWNHLLWYPQTTTYVRAKATNKVYRIVSGKPVAVTSWASVGGVKPTTVVDNAAIAYAGRGSVWNHLRK
ncbi:hypothetical protein GIS00_09260 [Nakamurella sp. YIM 132087]|uniref:SCP domain-containing protein n=1 Tax=Nakamurella alba TaxID=2665158 RepID=A0A7K1FJ35_9ACTN|nr:CAP domain-containing protein [Nakamurella alba]MTD14132.1 hypothetical protein [Nakamurella alba]